MKLNNQDINLAQTVSQYNGNIIGYDNSIGIYKIIAMSAGGTHEETKISGVGKEKFELERNGEENFMRYDLVSSQINFLLGEILTIIDATMDEPKCKAVKDLVKDKFYSKMSWLYELSGLQEGFQDSLGE